MSNNKATANIMKILDEADIQINGNRPWDIKIHNPKTLQRVWKQQSIGLGESYMEEWWDVEKIDEFFYKLFRHGNIKKVYGGWAVLSGILRFLIINQQTKLRSLRVAKQHYNLGNDLYEHMLGDSMAYTCAYWKDAPTLNAAQYAKYDLICRKLQLQPGDKVLELGCGWGGFSRYAAQNYQCEMTAVNIASEQMKYAAKICQNLPVDLHVCDYRDVKTYNPKGIRFDKVVSIGLCEHIGYKNYLRFLNLVREQLEPSGLFLLHTIGKNRTTYYSDPWIQKYIFPGGMLPSIRMLSRAIEGNYVIEDLHNFGSNYDLTLMAWEKNFVKSWPLIHKNYDKRFYRMWRYYLLSCAAAFRARDIQLWQFVLSPRGVLSGYQGIR